MRFSRQKQLQESIKANTGAVAQKMGGYVVFGMLEEMLQEVTSEHLILQEV